MPLANARLMARRMPAARLRVVNGGGHLFLVDEPETVADDIQAGSSPNRRSDFC